MAEMFSMNGKMRCKEPYKATALDLQSSLPSAQSFLKFAEERSQRSVLLCFSKNLFLLVGFAFVDDCDLIQSGKDPREVAESMQAVIREWGDLMEVTGGALETKKSYWYLIDYEWMRGKWTAVNGDAGDFELSV